MDKQIFIFNGPPASGKDTICNYLAYKYNGDVTTTKLARPLKTAGTALFELTPDEFDHFEKHEFKSTPSDRFSGKSWRQVQIDLSESFIKPLYGADTFPKLLWHRIKDTQEKFVVVSDGGFDLEISALCSMAGIDNVHLIRIHRDGCDFGKDSRGYISDGLTPKTYDVYNNDTLENFLKQCESIFLEKYNGYIY